MKSEEAADWCKVLERNSQFQQKSSPTWNSLPSSCWAFTMIRKQHTSRSLSKKSGWQWRINPHFVYSKIQVLIQWKLPALTAKHTYYWTYCVQIFHPHLHSTVGVWRTASVCPFGTHCHLYQKHYTPVIVWWQQTTLRNQTLNINSDDSDVDYLN